MDSVDPPGGLDGLDTAVFGISQFAMEGIGPSSSMINMIPSGNDCYIAIEHCHRNIVDLPIEHGDFPVRYVNLPGRVIYLIKNR